MNPTLTPSLAVIGGSGLYSFVEAADQIDVSTPYGAPSGPISVGRIDGHPVAFLPRHGPHHELPPHEINYRANIWALRSLGVRRIMGPCAVGGLTSDVAPGDIVVPDQLVDRTTSRKQTYMDTGAVHAPFADPYCPSLRRALLTADPSATDGGTMVVIEGPRFSTRAESGSYRAAGWSLVNMTGHPEAVLARELGVCYAALALVTDMDAGIDAPADLERVFDVAWRGSHARTPGAETGAGLGLAIVKGLVEAHLGTVAVANRAPGCTFVVRLPAQPGVSSAP